MKSTAPAVAGDSVAVSMSDTPTVAVAGLAASVVVVGVIEAGIDPLPVSWIVSADADIASKGTAATIVATAAVIASGLKIRTGFNPLSDRDPRRRSRSCRSSPAPNPERSYRGVLIGQTRTGPSSRVFIRRRHSPPAPPAQEGDASPDDGEGSQPDTH